MDRRALVLAGNGSSARRLTGSGCGAMMEEKPWRPSMPGANGGMLFEKYFESACGPRIDSLVASIPVSHGRHWRVHPQCGTKQDASSQLMLGIWF